MKCPPRSPIEEEVLNKVKPDRKQETLLRRLYNLVNRVLSMCLREHGLKAEIRPVGSFAKDTYTRDKWELDVFILFEDVSDSWITRYSEDLLRACLRNAFPVMTKYAQHPYLTLSLFGMEADIVPALKLSTIRRKGFGVERTPFHTQYVLSRLNECMRDDVRLLKAFLKGIGVYGAETRIMGFSGYLSELLIIYYGSFRNLLRNVSEWKPPVYIDIEGVGDKEYLRRKYKNTPLIVVDPVDPGRNAAASVSLKSLATLVLAAKLYLKNPSKRFFYPYSWTRLSNAYGSLITIKCEGEYWDRPPESIWGKATRAAKELFEELKRYGFTPLYYTVDTDESSLVSISIPVIGERLPPVEVSRGPHAWERVDYIEGFLWKRLVEGYPVWIGEDGRLYGLRARKIEDVAKLIDGWVESRAPRLLGSNRCTYKVEECWERDACFTTPGWLKA